MGSRIIALAGAILFAATLAGSAAASHSWNNYHWARTSNPFTIRVIDSNSSTWDSHLDAAIADWSSSSSVLNVVEEAGSTDKRCRAVSGKVKSCNGNYGQNGWLGLAQIWLNGGHISQGTAKMNDTYFSMSQYNDATKRQHVMCQEIGHDWGLGHQDESGADWNTCMDYSSKLDNPNPNAHDFEQLVSIYGSHLDTSTTIAASLAETDGAKPDRVERNDRIADSVITEHFRDGSQKITHVFWALETRGRAHEQQIEREHENG
ncbi:MAG: hypothetical protein H0V94_08250 [Actinobacteria bacterium]|nr:hypothetical protein [Actinomycetota bacterium]